MVLLGVILAIVLPITLSKDSNNNTPTNPNVQEENPYKEDPAQKYLSADLIRGTILMKSKSYRSSMDSQDTDEDAEYLDDSDPYL